MTTSPSGPSGLTQKPQGSDLQAKANDDTPEEDNGMGSQMSPMTTAITLQAFGTNTVVILHYQALFNTDIQ